MNEPKTIRAGDTIEWTTSHSDYLASDGWSLTYYLRGAVSLDITGVDDNDEFDITISAADSATLTPGFYTLTGRFSKAAEKFTPEGFSTTVEVLADISVQTAGYDPRSHAQIALALIEDAIEKYAANPTTTLTIKDRSYTITSLNDLFALKKRYEWEVRSEEDAERVAKGLGRKKILTRFDRVS